MEVIFRNTSAGRRAYPITTEAVMELVGKGEARKTQHGFYEAIDPPVPEEPVLVAAPEPEPVYEAKVMQATIPKKRGRPRKVLN
jgi:hypothetical protein